MRTPSSPHHLMLAMLLLSSCAAAPIAAQPDDPARAAEVAKAWCSLPPQAVRGLSPDIVRSLDRNNPGPPNPLARIHVEGTLPHQGIYDESQAALRDIRFARDNALAWHAGAAEAYRQRAEQSLLAWSAVYQPSFNPIDETNMDTLVEVHALLAPTLTPPQRQSLRRFFTGWARGYVQLMDRNAGGHKRGDTWTNNWHSHRVKLVTMMAVALDDAELFADASRLFRAQLAQNVQPTGEVLDFALRDALHYVTYDLEPLLAAALAARTRGEDWYTFTDPRGASLQKAVAWLLPYAEGRITHQEFVHSTVRFDAERAAAGLPGFAGPFDPKVAALTVWQASRFDPALEPLARKLGPKPRPLLLCGQ